MIDVISIPVQLPIKKTNCIIIFEEPLTVIDPGVKSPSTFFFIREALGRRGRTIRDIKRILITHGHIDHFGAAPALRESSGAPIYIHRHDFLKSAQIHRKDDEYTLAYKEMLLLHGCPEAGLKGIDQFWDYIQDMYDPLTEPVFYEKETIDFETFQMEVIETPGHTQGSVCFYHRENQFLISGDTLIDGITPNPVIEFLETGDRFNSQAHFRESVDRLSNYKIRRIVAGHGGDILDFSALYKRYRQEWKKREENLIRILKKRRVLNAYEALEEIFGQLQDFNIFLGMSEVIGYLDYLASKNRIEYTKEQGEIRVRYRSEGEGTDKISG